MYKELFLVILVVSMTTLAACDFQRARSATKKMTQSQKAKVAAEQIKFTSNAEIANIKRRLETTSQPGLLGFLALVNAAGAPVVYTCMEGKLTSGGKSLTPKVQQWKVDHGQHRGTALGPAPSDEGTWGTSAPYVFGWTCGGQYIQTNVDYVYMDKPFRLKTQPLIAISEETQKAEAGKAASVLTNPTVTKVK